MPAQRKSQPRSPAHAALGQAIELLIAEDAQMSQDSVAHESGLNLRQVNDYVRGQGNPTYMTLLRLCAGLHVSLGELMTRADDLRETRPRPSDRESPQIPARGVDLVQTG
jgi:transcriptional regulator with XRE-family HTH domain